MNMLLQLTIQNFTVIDTLELEFESGMTVLTGETGAGKTIIVDALLLALGARADTTVIRHAAERCSIAAFFDVQLLTSVQAWLNQHDLNVGNECLLRRTINRAGHSRGFINGQPVPLHKLRALGQLVLSLHGQHEHQTLLVAEKQRELLDAYGEHTALCKQVHEHYSHLRQAQKELELLKDQTQQYEAKKDLLAYYLKEFDDLALQENEVETLGQEQRQLAHVDQLLVMGQDVLNLISDHDEFNALSFLNKIDAQLDTLKNFDSSLDEVKALISQAVFQVGEASYALHRYFDRMESNPDRLAQVEQRLACIQELARKHHVKPEQLLETHQALQNQLKQLTGHSNQVELLEKQIEALTQAYHQAAACLTKKRRAAAKQLEPLVKEKLQQLAMPAGTFKVKIFPNKEIASYGLERVEFYVSANLDQLPQPLAKVASGGELSRVSLAIHVLTARKDAMPTLIFDEVDVGVSGGTAECVGRLLQLLGQTTQILCITHLPQVAAQGHHHLQVRKEVAQGVTHVRVEPLNQQDKIKEIARMLGGLHITQQALAHAKEMLEHV